MDLCSLMIFFGSREELSFAVMHCFPEADPDVYQSQAAGDPTYEAAGHQFLQRGITDHQAVMRPLISPGEDHQDDSERSAEEDEGQHQQPVPPEPARRCCWLELAPQSGQTGRSIGKLGVYEGPGVALQWHPRVCGHAALRKPGGPKRNCPGARPPSLRVRSIWQFYDFRAFIRSATSR